MGSNIALPALDLRPPQMANPLDELSKLSSLQALAGQRQLQEQQITGATQENQMRQLQINDALKMRELSPQYVTRDSNGKVTGYDWNGFQNAAMSAGVSPGTIAAAGKAQADYQLSLQNLNAKQRENQEALNKFGFEALENVRGEKDPQQRQSKYTQAYNAAQKMGADMSQYPQQVPDDKGLDVIEAGLGMHAQALANLKTQAETTEAQQRGEEAAANTKKAQAETQFFAQNPTLGAPGVPAETVQMSDWMRKNPGKTPADFMKYRATLVPQFNFNLQNQGIAGQGGQPSAIAQAIASGQMKWQDAVSPRTPASVKETLLREVKGINPNFNSGDFAVEQKVKEYMTSGRGGQQITAYNTALQHLDLLDKLADDLGNSNIQIANRASQAWARQTGNPAPANFQAAVNAMSGEVAAALKASGATDEEIGKVQSTFSNVGSPAQIHGPINTYRTLLRSKANNLKAQYQQGIQAQPNFGDNTPGGSVKEYDWVPGKGLVPR